MKRYMLPMILLLLTMGCNSAEEEAVANRPSNLEAKEMLNFSYGKSPDQKIDIYLPAGRNENTKVFILVHGGGWSGGSKADFNYIIPILRAKFPKYAIVNMNYRLATADSPAFPKQVQDIETVIQHLKESDYHLSTEYAFIGASAGAHLAMLYSYKYDTHNNVKAVCNIVGPSDFTDPFYENHPYFQYGAMYLIGDIDYQKHPEASLAVSPAMQVTENAPATIMFYGGKDPVVPSSQGIRLKAKLDASNVYNEYHVYANGGHGNWNSQTMTDFSEKMVTFFQKKF